MSEEPEDLESETPESETADSEETAVEEAAVAVAEPEPEFDLSGVDGLSFALLQEGRAQVFRNQSRAQKFARDVAALGATDEPGRRKGLGYWVLGEYERAVEQLAKYEGDDVADFTRARALQSLHRPGDALPLLERLVKSYPDESRPRGALIEARLDRELARGGEDAAERAVAFLDAELAQSTEDFRESAYGLYLQGRRHELANDPEEAIDHYLAAKEQDPTLRGNLVHGAALAERSGLDEVALKLYELALRLREADYGVLLNLGVLYEDFGRDQDAAAIYDLLAKRYPTDRRVRLYLQDAVSGIDAAYDEELERKEDKLNQILRIPITDFELSVRARNCLNKMQIHTLGDLVSRTEQELLAYKNFGETSLNEIKDILRSKGLRLGMPREEAVASIESRARRTPSGEGSDTLNKPVTDLQLSIRARRTVESLGCLTVGDITKHSADELLGMPNFGSTSLQELRGKLAELGLKLAGE